MTKKWLRASKDTALHYFEDDKSLCGLMKRPARPVEAATDRSAPDYAYCLQCKKHKAKASQRPASRQTKDKMFLVTNPYGVQVSLHRTRAGAKARLAQFRLGITDANARALCSVERIAVED